MAEPVTDWILTPHVVREMERRSISEDVVRQVLRNPEQRMAVRTGRDVLQSRAVVGGKPGLIRVFVDVDRRPMEVVTVYRTSKITKYWRSES